MLSLNYGFDSTIQRSGHAACWCAALEAIVQFGGWPPSSQLVRVMELEASRCPLYVLPLSEMTKGARRAQRRRADVRSEKLLYKGLQRGGVLRRQLERSSANATDETAGAGGIVPDTGYGSEEETLSSCSTTSFLSAELDLVEGFNYDEGYHSDTISPASSSSSSSPLRSSSARGEEDGESEHHSPPSPLLATVESFSLQQNAPFAVADDVTAAGESQSATPTRQIPQVAFRVTAELLQQLTDWTPSGGAAGVSSSAHTQHERNTTTRSEDGRQSGAGRAHSSVASTYATIAAVGAPVRALEREAAPILLDAAEVPGKYTTRALRWRRIRPLVAPRTRHGHHLVCHGDRLYVLGGSYWAHGNALATTDMYYDVKQQAWHQMQSSLFPPRFCASVATSNAKCRVRRMMTHRGDSDTTWGEEAEDTELATVLYSFGGLTFTRSLSSTLHRLWLPTGELEELPQYGAVPRNQFKGVLVCDIQVERDPVERARGLPAEGRLFYMDGFQEGKPMAPALRCYNLATGVWTKLCPCPDLARSQLSYTSYVYDQAKTVEGSGASYSAVRDSRKGEVATRLVRFDVLGGMPCRRGKQRRSRMAYSYDVDMQCFDYVNAMPVPGLTSHVIVQLPRFPSAPALKCNDKTLTGDAAAVSINMECANSDQAAEHLAPVKRFMLEERITAICVGGAEDVDNREQDSLGVPVGWVYLLGPRAISLNETVKVSMDKLRFPYKMLAVPPDDLIDDLF